LVNFISFKIGRIILILNGRHAGKKGIIVENEIQSKNEFSNSLTVLGLKNIPKRVCRKKNNHGGKTTKIKVFFKSINKNHILPTRYFVDLNQEQQILINKVSNEFFKIKSNGENYNKLSDELKWQVNNIFLDKYISGKNKWFFRKLNF